MNLRTTALLIALIMLPLSTLATERVIAVKGEASIEVMPDQITLDVYVESKHKNDIAKAKAVVDEVSSNVARALIENGVDASDITSATISIGQDEEWDRYDNPVTVGHIASRDIEVIVRDVSAYSKLVQAMVDVGVTDVSGGQPEVSNYDELHLQALGEAAKDARSKAEYLAGELDATVARVHRIGDNRVTNHFMLEEVVVTGARHVDAPYEFELGPIEVSATIYVEFELE